MRGKESLSEQKMVLEQGLAQGRADPFDGPAAHFYSLKTENSYEKGGIR